MSASAFAPSSEAPAYHACCLYASEEERRSTLTRFLVDGILKERKVVCATFASLEEQVLSDLEAEGIDTRPVIDSGQLVIVSSPSAYTPEGVFSLTRGLDRIRLILNEAESEGYPGAHVAGDVFWLASAPHSREAFLEYESAVNRILEEHGGAALCLYDRRRFRASDLLRCLSVHPSALVADEELPNPHFVPASTMEDDQPVEQELARRRKAAAELAAATRTTRNLKNALRRVREAQARFRAITEGITDGVLTIDAASRIMYANPAAHRMFRIPTGGLEGVSLTDLIPARLRERHRAGLRRYLATGRPTIDWSRVRMPALRDDGTEFPVEISFGEHERDGHRYFTGVIRDVTERERMEAKLLRMEKHLHQAQRMEALGRLAGGIAHDFNNLLTLMQGHADMALHALPDDHSARAEVEGILESVARASEMSRHLLVFSRERPLQMMAVDLAEVVAGTRDMLRRLIPARIELTLDASEGVPRVMGDASQLQRVLVNLALNAADAIEGHGTISISLQRASPDPELLGTLATDDPAHEVGVWVCLSVSDTGVGIPPAAQERIFEPFYTTKTGKGTGLGLSTVYGIVRQLGGRATVESDEGTGSTFQVFLPGIDPALDEPDPSI
jgi:PAS domain S-box-containing protein